MPAEPLTNRSSNEELTMDAQSVLQLEEQQHTFHGLAVAEIQRGLVLGLCAAVENERVRNLANLDRELGRPWAPGTVPVEPAEHALSEIANALLWCTPKPDTSGEDDPA